MIFDISQEVFHCAVFPGDPTPEYRRIASMESGSPYNLTAFSMCAHNGTHIDAPFHFLQNGMTVERIPLEVFAGWAYVVTHHGAVSSADAERMVSMARDSKAGDRILVRGAATITADASRVFASAGIRLIGNESQTVGPEEAPTEVHRILLGAGVVLLEGLRLSAVSDGRYLLSAAPLKLGGSDGAPCRAFLMTEDEVCTHRLSSLSNESNGK